MRAHSTSSSKLPLILIVYLLLYSTRDVDGVKKAEEGTKSQEKSTPSLPKRTSFEEEETWATSFPDCNPENNDALSPINIDTNEVIRTEKDEQALIFWSGPPLRDNYYFSTTFNNDGVGMEVLNIGPKKESFRETTYISGAGNSEYRYFSSALFLFTTTPLDATRSVHQINGKKFPMEIVMTFADIPRDNSPPTDVTQVHVSVDIQEASNPGFFFLPEVWEKFSTSPVGEEMKMVATDTDPNVEKKRKQVDAANKSLQSALAEEKKESGDDGYEALHDDLEKLYDTVKSTENTKNLAALEKQLTENAKIRKEAANALQVSREKIQKELDDQQDEIARLINAGSMLKSDRNEKTDNARKLQDSLTSIDSDLSHALTKLQQESIQLYQVSSEIRENKALLKEFKIGKESGSIFKSVKDVKKKLAEMKIKKNKLIALKESVAASINSLENEIAQPPRNYVIQNWFQATWLLPIYGGYYRYMGSCVVPPCTKRTRVLVLETPIAISKEQLAAFQKMVKGRTQAEITQDKDAISFVDQTIPRLRDLGKRKVYYNKKNLQYKLDDSFHMLSKLRRKIKDDMKKNTTGEPIGGQRSFILRLVLVLLLKWFAF